MKLSHVTIFVKNLEESVAFYRDITGLPITRRFASGPDREIVFLGGGETMIELVGGAGEVASPTFGGISLGFETASLDGLIAELEKKGVSDIGDILRPNPQVQFFFITDPNGLRIQFVEYKK
ncbi:MAG: VOC family protein [Synergistaceae bacterium]|nr:VOC family protein [Synergistaceae bacterium]